MKRFLMFATSQYYPMGGWSDFVSEHDTLDEATAAGRAATLSDYWHVVDMGKMRIVEHGDTVPENLPENK